MATDTAADTAGAPAGSGPNRIERVDGKVAQRICSDQVIVDLPSALKELLENALDAGATRLDVRLREHGVELLEVADNGKGIASIDLDGVALRHTTSKLSEFDDLQQLSSFGFRGEALNSLAALSSLAITTRTQADVTATALTFHTDGSVAGRAQLARDVGTCVSVGTLFAPFPVRRRELSRNASSEFRRVVSTLQAYALICDGVRFTCTHTLAKGSKQTLLQTPGGTGGLRASISAVFGAKLLSELTPLHATAGGIEVRGFISRPRAGDGRRAGDRQYLYVNGRPVDFPRLARLLNEAYRHATARAECFPVAFLDLRAPSDSYDINVTPDKRTVLFADEARLLSVVRTMLEELFAADSCTLQMHQPTLPFATTSASAASTTSEAVAAPTAEPPVPAAATDVPAAEGGTRADEAGDADTETDEEAPVEKEEAAAEATAAEPMVEEVSEKASVPDALPTREADPPAPVPAQAAAAAPAAPPPKPPALDGSFSFADFNAGATRKREHASDARVDKELGAPPSKRMTRGGQASIERVVAGGTPREDPAEMVAAVQPVAEEAAAVAEEEVEVVTLVRTGTTSTDVADADEGGGTTERATDGPAPASEDESPSMSGLMALLRAARAECAEEGKGHIEELQLALATFAQQMTALAHARPVRPESCCADGSGCGGEASLLAQLSACSCRYLKGWLAAHAGSDVSSMSVISEFEIESALAVAGWGWEEEAFLDSSPDCSADSRQQAELLADAFASIGKKVNAATAAALPKGRRGGAEALHNRGRAGRKRLSRDASSKRQAREAAGSSGGEESDPAWEEEEDDDDDDDEGADGPDVGSTQSSSVQAKGGGGRNARRGRAAHPLYANGFPADLVVDYSVDAARLQLPSMPTRREPSLPASVDSASASPALPVAAGGGRTVPDAGSLERATRVATAEVELQLSRVLPKESFCRMQVLGQFNLGFIITRAQRPASGEGGEGDGEDAPGADLYIVDQHAADEKSRFETLNGITQIHTQRLIAPLPLHLTAADELLVIDHMHVFNANGFHMSVDAAAPPTQRLHLVALPFSKETVFGPADVHELVTLLSEAPGGHCTLPKLRAMFARRACRSSVMIGTALDEPKMTSLVRKLASLDQPWNCPHGRPTLRHLVDLEQLANTAAATEFEQSRLLT